MKALLEDSRGAFYFYQVLKELYSEFLSSTGVSTDTRKIEAGKIFFALKGDNFNGNEYANQAEESGAKALILDDLSFYSGTKAKVYQVEDVLTSLQELANYHRRQLNTHILGITGSNGKTTTKELLQVGLSSKLKTFVTPGNLNNHIGVPLSLLQIERDCEVAVIELGDNHMGEVAMLCKIAEPDSGYITNLGKDHIEGFGSYENNILAKKELFDYLKASGGFAFINDLDTEVLKMSTKLKGPKMSEFEEKYQMKYLGLMPKLHYSIEGKTCTSNLVGSYNYENILACHFICDYFEVEIDQVASAIADFMPDNNRSQLIDTQKENTVYLDAYNANPSSMELALQSFDSIDTELPKVAILGDMLELGDLSKAEHQNIVDIAESLPFQEVMLIGNEFSQCKLNSAECFNNVEDALDELKRKSFSKTYFLLKGSRGIRV